MQFKIIMVPKYNRDTKILLYSLMKITAKPPEIKLTNTKIII